MLARFLRGLILAIVGGAIVLRQLAARAFGEWTWKPPAWIGTLRERAAAQPWLAALRARWRAVHGWIANNPRKLAGAGVAGVVLAIAAIGGYWWYDSLPRPVEFSLVGTAPSATPLKDDARPDSVHIDFSGSAARLDQIGKPVTVGIRMSPAIAGAWLWSGDSRLSFTPKEDWAVDQEYVVKFDRAMFPDHVRLSQYEYRFRSAPFSAQLAQIEFYQDPRDPKLKKVVATLKFSHAVDSADLEKRISLRMQGQKEGILGFGRESYPYTISYDKFKGEAYIHSDPVTIPLKDTHMQLAVDAGVRAERGGAPTRDRLERQVWIPGVYNFFRVESSSLTLVRNERYEPEQVLVVKTTAGVLESELQKALAVWELPEDRPETVDRKAQRKHYWGDTTEIGPEILALAKPVKLEPIPTGDEYARLHSFKYQAEVGRYLYVKLGKGIESYGGYVLARDFDNIQRVPEFPKELNIMYDGALLSLSGEKKLTVLSRDVPALRFELGRVIPSQINHLVSQSGGRFKSPHFNNYTFGQDNITERFSEVRELRALPPGKTQYSAFDLSGYLSPGDEAGARRGLFFFSVESWDPRHKRGTGITDQRLVLITNLGLLIKDNADGSHDVFVQSIADGRPVAGASVQVLGKNGVAVVTATTDADGHARFPELSGFKREQEPVVYVARRGDDLSFLPYDRRDRQLDFSRFNVGGERTTNVGARLNAYLFSDRGVYRPGDELRVAMIVKSADWGSALAGVPLETVISDARGLEVYKRKISLSAAGFEEMRYTTEEASPTGNYTASVYIVKDGHRANLLGTTSLRVEEFLPDRLNISTRFSAESTQGWVAPGALGGMVSLRNLFGTPASDRRVAANINLSPAYPSFRGYADYRFYDPLRAKNGFSERLEDARTDANGEARFELGLERFDKSTYRVSFVAEGYEAAGGRGVVSESTVLVSPLEYIIGYKPDGELRYMHKGSMRKVQLIAINPALNKIKVDGIQAQILELRYVSVLAQQPNGTFKYESVRKETTVSKKDLTIPAQGMDYRLPTDRPGDYALVVRAADDTELNRVEYSVVGQANITRSLEKNAELQVKLDRSDYAAGDEIELQIKAPYVGAGLITIERDRVYAYKWFTTTTTGSVERIRVPADLEGNGYVNVAFVRAMGSPEIFMSPLSYGVAAFSVSREKRMNAITLEHAELARPGEPLRIRYRTERPGKIVVFAVDEGILQVAGYKTPDPLSHFFRKRALEVSTAQILDLILPEFRLIQELSAPGGDDEGREAIGKNLNPFKRKREAPVVYWSGIIDSDGQTRELVYPVPDYFNGSLRVMAVAVTPDTVGVAERKATVRGHFVLSPNVPTFVAPGDEFQVSLGVANNVEGSGKQAEINIELDTSEHLEVLGPARQTVKIDAHRESVVTYRLKARNVLGSGSLKFSAAMADKRARYTTDLSVRPPVPYMTTVASGHIQSGKVDVPVTRRMYPHYRTLAASASPLPLGVARGLISYLERFPYGCTEQLVSQAFPAVVLRNRPEFGYAPGKVEANLAQVLRVLRARQNAEGAFGFWAANSHVSDLQVAYALHFLTEARERGYAVPQDLLDRGLGYLRSIAQKEPDNLSQARERAYAIYVLTRNGQVTTNYLNIQRSVLERDYAKLWKTDLTGAYLGAAYKMLKQEREADKLIGASRFGQPQQVDYAYFYDGLVRDAQLLYLLARHFPERLPELEAGAIEAVVKPIADGRFNTLSSAYTILALDAYADTAGVATLAELSLTELQADNGARPLVLPKGLFPTVDFSDKAQKIRIASGADFHLYYQVTQGGFDLVPPAQEIKQQLEIQREYRSARGEVVDNAALGGELTVHLKIRSIEEGGLANVAVVDLLPGGFEVVRDSIRGSARPASPTRHERDDAEAEAVADAPDSTHAGGKPGAVAFRPDYVDIREDRVVVFGHVSREASEFSYRIKAVNQGRYAVPPVFGESMYDRGVQARGLGASMTVGAP
ncbi:MAG TPA: alpha-2-macroglobulin [Acidiferrobacterales bacterium]